MTGLPEFAHLCPTFWRSISNRHGCRHCSCRYDSGHTGPHHCKCGSVYDGQLSLEAS